MKNFKTDAHGNDTNISLSNCKDKSKSPLDGDCNTVSVIYKAEVEDFRRQTKVYVACTDSTFKKRWYNHRFPFKLGSHRHCTKQTSHVWEFKERCNRSFGIRWGILRRVKFCNFNGSICKLCQEEKLAIVIYLDRDKLLNEQSEVMSKCRDVKHILAQYKPG